MLKFVKVLFLFLLLVFLLDRVTVTVANKLFLYSSDVIRFAFNDNNDDVIILGSSRAKHYDPRYIEHVLGDSISCFSYGSSGQNIYFHYAILNTILETTKPRIVILDLMDIDVKQTSDFFNTGKLSKLYPLYELNDTVKSIVNLQGKNAQLGLQLSKLYHHNSKIPSYIEDIILNKHKNNNLIGLTGSYYGEISINSEDDFMEDKRKIGYVQRLINLCNNEKINLFVIVSPIFEKYPNGNSNLSKVLNSLNYGDYAKFWSYETDTTFISSNELFYDRLHLNQKGLKIFNEKLGRRIKQYFD